MPNNINRIHYFFYFLSFVLFCFFISQGEQTYAEETQLPPSDIALISFSEVTTSEDVIIPGITLEEGMELDTYMHIKFTDPNGCNQVTDLSYSGFSLAMYHSVSSSGQHCASPSDQDFTTCLFYQDVFSEAPYQVSTLGDSPSCDPVEDNDVTYRFLIQLPHTLKETDSVGEWKISSTLTDSTGTSTQKFINASPIEVHSTNYIAFVGANGLTSTVDIAFGERSLGSTGTASNPIKVRNTSNEILDLYIESSDMECTGGGIIESYDAQNQYIGIRVSGFDVEYDQMQQLAQPGNVYTSGTKLGTPLDVDIPVEDVSFFTDRNINSSTKNIYFGLGIPTSGLRDNCSGNIIFSSVVSL